MEDVTRGEPPVKKLDISQEIGDPKFQTFRPVLTGPLRVENLRISISMKIFVMSNLSASSRKNGNERPNVLNFSFNL